MSETEPRVRKTYDEHVRELRKKGQALLKRYGWLKVTIQIGFVCLGTFMFAIAGFVVANTGTPVPIPAGTDPGHEVAANKELWRNVWRSVAFFAQFVGVVLVFGGTAFLAFVDKGAADTVAEALTASELAQDAALAERERAARAIEEAAAKILRVTEEANERLVELSEDLEASDEFLEEFRNQNAAKNRQIERLRMLYTILRSVMLEALEETYAPEKKDIQYLIGAMLDQFIAFKKLIFDIGDENYSFSVYIPDSDPPTKLTCLVTRRQIRKDEERCHRDWPLGVGVSGRVFQSGEEQVWLIRDRSDFAKLGYDETHKRDEDFSENRCIAGVPIRFRKKILGVLTVSCAKEGLFETPAGDAKPPAQIDPVEPIRALSSLIALVLAQSETKR